MMQQIIQQGYTGSIAGIGTIFSTSPQLNIDSSKKNLYDKSISSGVKCYSREEEEFGR